MRPPILERRTTSTPEPSMMRTEGTTSTRDPSTRVGRAPSRSPRISVLGPPRLFADRTTILLRELGLDARSPRAVGSRDGARARLAHLRRGLATDLFVHLSGRSRFGRLQRCLASLGVPTLLVWPGSDVAR